MDIKKFDFYYSLRKLPFVEAIYLYGSRAKNTHRMRSDIDVAIVCPLATSADWQTVVTIIETAATLFEINCVRFDIITDQTFKKEIEDHRVILFQKVPNVYEWYLLFLDVGESIEKFKNAVNVSIDKEFYLQDKRIIAIHTFECTFELFWKMLKKICVFEGFETNSPRETLQKSFAIKLIDNDSVWLSMLNDRNMTTHTYGPPTAQEVFDHCQLYAIIMDKTYKYIQTHYKL